MKQVLIFSVMLFFAVMAPMSSAADKSSKMEKMKHHDMMRHNMGHSVIDDRVSLGLSPQMKQHQLSNMRSHLDAVQAIVSLIAKEDFDKASEIARSKLGLSEEMQRMCNMFDNKDFKARGLAFHESGDILSDTLKTKDTNKSLRALSSTLNHCVQCHAVYRQ